ncbi:ADP-ribosylglycohydrolase family protein [Sulfitobacter sp. F26169L]|uniref:ADP-ribosylglycohydrolase family protein n=1 Tax=Sulfitobacter sp. F26169L TaxID=2996015 RepID=UPI002260BE52|nr:ADP-ribosylglycohydrolase family protein [Sulfitobacter sp. F26169L]MCX7567261.1 ADP-ribosylglycohydrolase family protein [Sulfitobacter sp. F26169L]
MILGALVADAAALGLHWIYDQDHIRRIAPDAPEFMSPDPMNYKDGMGYFAHQKRPSGALSQYGEQTMVMLWSLAASGGHFDPQGFANQFREYFGYGGDYVGYIDHATRDTLDNFRRFEDAAQACANDLLFNSDDQQRKAILSKALALMNEQEGAKLSDAFDAALHKISDDANVVRDGRHLLDALIALPHTTGAFDFQLPAIAKLPALVAALHLQGKSDGPDFLEAVGSAIRTTNDHPIAVTYGIISARMMTAALVSGSLDNVINAALITDDTETRDLLQKAVAMKDKNNAVMTKKFGMACDLPYGVPSALHNIATASGFRSAVRQNIYAGGDSCGRAILVGAVMGAVHGIGGEHGIPLNWIDRLEKKGEATRLLNQLFG